jgi:hypothetical protein
MTPLALREIATLLTQDLHAVTETIARVFKTAIAPVGAKVPAKSDPTDSKPMAIFTTHAVRKCFVMG